MKFIFEPKMNNWINWLALLSYRISDDFENLLSNLQNISQEITGAMNFINKKLNLSRGFIS